MLRRTLWLVFSLFPVLSFAAFVVAARHTSPPDWPIWGALLSAGVPAAIVEGVRGNWYFGFLGLVAAHYAFFVLHPFFNGAVSGWIRKPAWAVSTLLFYPLVPPIYALLCIGNGHTEPKAQFGRARAYPGRTSR